MGTVETPRRPLRAVDVQPPRWALFYVLVAAFFHFWWGADMRRFAAPPAALALVAAGASLIAWAAWRLRAAGTPVAPGEKPLALVVDGPYRFSRNPMYLGLVLVLFGVALNAGTLPFYLAPLAFFLTVHWTFLRWEEVRLERAFGDEYRRYKRTVRRWL